MDHNILFNSKKTVCMAMLPGALRNMSLPMVTLCDESLNFVNEYRYLGYQISNDFSRADDFEIRQQYRSLCCRVNSLIRKFSLCSYSVKRHMYSTYCSNVSNMYLWHSYHMSVMKKFKVCFNNAARMFFGYDRYCSASGMFTQEGIDGYDAVYRKSVWNFVSRLTVSENRIIASLFHSDLVCTSSIRRMWSKALYSW